MSTQYQKNWTHSLVLVALVGASPLVAWGAANTNIRSDHSADRPEATEPGWRDGAAAQGSAQTEDARGRGEPAPPDDVVVDDDFYYEEGELNDDDGRRGARVVKPAPGAAPQCAQDKGAATFEAIQERLSSAIRKEGEVDLQKNIDRMCKHLKTARDLLRKAGSKKGRAARRYARRARKHLAAGLQYRFASGDAQKDDCSDLTWDDTKEEK
jgi:hypothetical protein